MTAPVRTHDAPVIPLATAGIMLALASTATLPPAIVACVPVLTAALAYGRVR